MSIDLSIHGVKSIKCIDHQLSDGTWVKKMFVKTNKEMLELSLFSNKAANIHHMQDYGQLFHAGVNENLERASETQT